MRTLTARTLALSFAVLTILVPLWLAVPAALADDTAPQTLTPEILVDLHRVSSVTLAPDGKQAAYLLSVQREDGDEPGSAYRELRVANLENGETRRYAGEKESISSPAFSPDGKRIAFLVERENFDEHRQIYTLRLRGGEAVLLTHHENGVSSYRWSPSGGRIAFRANDPETEDEKEDEKAGRDWKVEGENQKYGRLWLFDVKKKTSRQLTEGELDVHEFAWTPDEKTLVFRSTPTTRVDDDYMFSQLHAVDIEKGGEPRQLAHTPGKVGETAISPDGEHLAFLGAVSQNDPIAQNLFLLPLTGGSPKNLTDGLEASAAHVDWLDAARLLLTVSEGTHTVLYEVDAASGSRRRLDWPEELVISQIELQAENGLLAVVAHAASHPQELYVARADGSGARRVHNHNPVLDDLRLARQEVVTWTGPGDVEIEGVLTWPLDAEEGQRVPLVLQVHGGPEGVSPDGWTSSAGYPVQLLARDGFMVLQPNYRGSGGRGVAFSKADHDDLGGTEFDDILAGVDALIERGLVDGDRVGTGGWSYGGYMSALAATRWSERFRASVMAAGISNWVSFTGTTDIPYEMSIVHWNSWWFDEPELHWKRSPLAHINQARTATLILHGEEDTRVHPEQGLELYTALRVKEVPTQFVLYPREGHGLGERAHQLDAIGRMRAWFGDHLGLPVVKGVEEPRD